MGGGGSGVRALHTWDQATSVRAEGGAQGEMAGGPWVFQRLGCVSTAGQGSSLKIS